MSHIDKCYIHHIWAGQCLMNLEWGRFGVRVALQLHEAPVIHWMSGRMHLAASSLHPWHIFFSAPKAKSLAQAIWHFDTRSFNTDARGGHLDSHPVHERLKTTTITVSMLLFFKSKENIPGTLPLSLTLSWTAASPNSRMKLKKGAHFMGVRIKKKVKIEWRKHKSKG